MLGLDDPVEALVNPLMMVVLEVLGNNIAKLFLRRQDEMMKSRAT